ncbi:N-acetyltransferase [Bacteroides sp.]|uniref:N-acetyltransferase n=1 Tax=Bacteroides sp. TaxID=29523 RepID=UPI0025C05DCA|nr:N-acetyltransferase [Bacteroides sp.]
MKEGTRVIRLSQDYIFKAFDCGNQDLNDFLLQDAKEYDKRLLSVTYILETDEDIVAYFSVSNDKIAIPDSDKATWRKIKALFPHRKHRSDYPAVKIGRLGVSLKYQHTQIGTDILDFIKEMFINNNRTGCSFVTVDALKSALSFYLKNNFLFLDKVTAADDTQETYLLYYNLAQLLD